jgi:histidine triad (HIT) family protein
MFNSDERTFFKMKKDDCIFCKLSNGDIPTSSVYEDDKVKVIFDASPASRGHLLLIPKDHFDNIYELDDETAGHIFKVAKKVACALKASLDYDGLNVLQNNGEAAGQTVFHFHMHFIPRIKGDTIKVGWTPGQQPEDIEDLKKIIADNFA